MDDLDGVSRQVGIRSNERRHMLDVGSEFCVCGSHSEHVDEFEGDFRV